VSAGAVPTRPRERAAGPEAEPDQRLAALAHELRTPLTSVEGWVELLLDGSLGPLTPEQRRAVATIGRNAGRARELLTGVVTPHRRVDVAAVVRAAVDVVRPAARLADLALEEDVPASGTLVATGDEAALERALLNVLANAVKYTPAGGRVRVTARRAPDREEVVVEVVDTGIGVPAEDLPHLAEPGFRARNALASGAPGDGLGLAQVHDVMAAHGCRLSLSSPAGGGTAVRLHLPAPGPAGGRNARRPSAV
jgi:signal transduction histidine kinase